VNGFLRYVFSALQYFFSHIAGNFTLQSVFFPAVFFISISDYSPMQRRLLHLLLQKLEENLKVKPRFFICGLLTKRRKPIQQLAIPKPLCLSVAAAS